MNAEDICPGLTPRELERIMATRSWRQRAWDLGVTSQQLRALCARWGIEAPPCKKPGPTPAPRLPISESNRIIDAAYKFFGSPREVCLCLGTYRERLYDYRRRGLNVETAKRWQAEWPGMFE